jgi:vancomycin permeability regulator SanA
MSKQRKSKSIISELVASVQDRWETMDATQREEVAGLLACAYRKEQNLPDIQIAVLLGTTRATVRALIGRYWDYED